MSDLQHLIKHAELLLQRLEAFLPPPAPPVDWQTAIAFRYRRHAGLLSQTGSFQPIRHVEGPDLSALGEVDQQKERLLANTAQFVAGKPANNVLLSGARGTGKSSLIKACLKRFSAQGLRLVEVDKNDLLDLPDITALLSQRPEKFILYCDDLSFESSELGYKALKSLLDGSLTSNHNVLVYATSNRRHLLPEYHSEKPSHSVDGELHPNEAIEEKISLSERFGLWLSFYPFNQDEYLRIVAQWLSHYGFSAPDIAAAKGDALIWALERGSRSGRVANQFARDYAGKNAT